MYLNGHDDTHMEYSHIITTTNYYQVQQEHHQFLQE